MNQLDTGYYINEEGHIMDTGGTTTSHIQNDLILQADGMNTGYSVRNGRIITKSGEYTGYMIIDKSIFGPFRALPWL